MRIVLAILIIFAFGVFGFFSYLGMFAPYEVQEMNIGPYKYVYKEHIGPYEETGQIGLEIYEDLMADGIVTTRGLGVYYDNPSVTPKEELRSEMGSIVETHDYEKFEAVKDKYMVREVPVTKAVTIKFPIKNMLSYMFGPMKVYPIIEKHFEEMDYSMDYVDVGYEIYDEPNNEIIYAVPIVK